MKMMTTTTTGKTSATIIGLAIVTVALFLDQRRRKRRRQEEAESMSCAYEELIGSTPLIALKRLSKRIKRKIFVKLENMNPGGTGKDRAALGMILDAEAKGRLPKPAAAQDDDLWLQTMVQKESSQQSSSLIEEVMKRSRSGGLVVEGTSGSTGIALATLCAARGHACLVVMPDDQAKEKQMILRALGAVVHVVPNVAISNPNHYVNMARRLALQAKQDFGMAAIFVNQFENLANARVHYERTGPELWKQCCQQLDAFVMSSGTGGTLAGVGRYLKEKASDTKIVLVDPPGSALFSKIKYGVAFAPQQKEQGLKRHRYDTLAEGIGLDRMTQNFAWAVDIVDDAIQVSDQAAVDMAHWLLQNEGLWVGSSSAMNIVGAVQYAKSLPEGSKVVTIVCDSGQRHVTRFWNRDFIVNEWGLQWPADSPTISLPECLQQNTSS